MPTKTGSDYDADQEKADKFSANDDLGGADLNKLTGIDKFEEEAMEERARSGASEETDKKSSSKSEIADAEADGGKPKSTKTDAGETNALNDQVGKGYEDDGKGPKKAAGGDHKKRNLLVGGGIAGGITGLLIAAFIALVPAKILSMVNGLQNRFFATSESALNARTEKLFDTYIKKHVLPNIGGTGVCKSSATIDRTCFTVTPGTSQASKLFSAWSEGRLENKMATDFGLEFAKQPAGTGYTLKAKGIPDVNFDQSFLSSPDGVGTMVEKNLGTAQFRQKYRAAFSDAMEGESKLTKVFYRFKVGRLLEKKYGVRRCIFACKTRDNFGDWGTNKRTAAKLIILRRVIEPHTAFVGYALECIISGACSPDPTTTTDGTERQDVLEKKVRAFLEKNAIEYTEDTVENILKLLPKLTQLLDQGLTSTIITTILEKIMSEEAAKQSVVVVGWIDLASKIINFLADAAPKIRRWAYAINSTAMISLWMIYRTQADEMKSGATDPELLGGLIDTLGDEAGDINHQDQPAEISPLYNELLGGTPVASSIFNIFSPTVYAQAPSTVSYTCNNRQPPQNGAVICAEESLITNNWLTSISDAFNVPPLSLLKGLAEFWKKTGGEILRQINGLLSFIGPAVDAILNVIPGISQLKDQLTEWVSALMQFVAEWLIPSPIGNMSGARAFNMVAGGADAAASATGQDQMGGMKLTPEQTAAIRNDREDLARTQFASRSLFYRMFETDDEHSFASQLALSIPTSKSRAIQSGFASLITNPFSKLFSGFSSLMSRPRVYAAATDDPFGIPQFGYALDDPILQMDPDILTDDYCANINKLWVENDLQINPATGAITAQTALPAEGDPDIGIDVHKTVNPCLLERSTVGSAGGYFDSSTLAPGDIGTPTTP